MLCTVLGKCKLWFPMTFSNILSGFILSSPPPKAPPFSHFPFHMTCNPWSQDDVIIHVNIVLRVFIFYNLIELFYIYYICLLFPYIFHTDWEKRKHEAMVWPLFLRIWFVLEIGFIPSCVLDKFLALWFSFFKLCSFLCGLTSAYL